MRCHHGRSRLSHAPQHTATLKPHHRPCTPYAPACSDACVSIWAVACADRTAQWLHHDGKLAAVTECDAITATTASTTLHNAQPPSSLTEHVGRVRSAGGDVCPYWLWSAHMARPGAPETWESSWWWLSMMPSQPQPPAARSTAHSHPQASLNTPYGSAVPAVMCVHIGCCGVRRL